MSYPPANVDVLRYRPTICGTPKEILEILRAKLPLACEGATRNGMHDNYYTIFAPLLQRATNPAPPTPNDLPRSRRSQKRKGADNTANKFRLLHDLFFSQDAADLATRDPKGFGRAHEWARIIARLANALSDALRLCLSPRLERADQLLDGSRMLAEDSTRKPRQTIATSLSKISPRSIPMEAREQLDILEKTAAFIKNDSDHGSPVVTIAAQVGGPGGNLDRNITSVRLHSEAQQQAYLDAISEGVAAMLEIEAEGVVSATAPDSWISGLLCLTSIQSHLGADLDSHGLDFWVCWMMNHSVMRNNPHLFSDDKFAPFAGLDAVQKDTRSERTQKAIYADLVRGTHSGIVRKLTVIWLDAKNKVIARHNQIANPGRVGIERLYELSPDFEERFPPLVCSTVDAYNKSKGIRRHETSDSGRRWDPKKRGAVSARVGKAELHAGEGRLRAFADTVLDGKAYNGIGLVSASPALLERIAEARRFVYAALVDADVDVAICVAYAQMIYEAKERYKVENPSFAKNLRGMFDTACTAVRSRIMREEDEIFIEQQCLSVHKSIDAMTKFGADDDTPLPSRWSNRTLQFHPSNPRDNMAYRGTFDEVFGSTGRGGTHGTERALVTFRKRQRNCQELLAAVTLFRTQAAAAVPGTVLLAPAIVLRVGEPNLMSCVDKQAVLATKAQTWHARLDEAVAKSVPRAKRNLILMAWRVALHSRLPLPTAGTPCGLPQRHGFNEYSFVFEVMAFAIRSSGGLSALICSQSGKLALVDPLPDDGTEFAWPAKDWGVFCAMAEAAAQFLVPPPHGAAGYVSFLAAAEGSPVRVCEGAILKVDDKRLALATPLVDERIALAQSLCGSVPPQSFLDLIATTNATTLAPVLASMLAWADEPAVAALVGAMENPAATSAAAASSTHTISAFLGIPNTVRGLLPIKTFRPADDLFADEQAHATRQAALCRASTMTVKVSQTSGRKRNAGEVDFVETTREDLFGSSSEDEG